MLVMCHQKDIRSLSNYRPISLTNVSYKIFASMLQSRLEIHVDSRIRDTQYGFRKNRSHHSAHTCHAQTHRDLRETKYPLSCSFLDWSKAFDSVTFTAIQAAMEHAGIPAHTRKAIMVLYNNPTFVVRDSSQKSCRHTHKLKDYDKAVLSPSISSA